MATASRRISRKDLRRPDWFQVTSERALEYFNHHQGLVFAALAAVLLIAGIVWGWQLFKERQNMAASQEFGRAMTLYQGEKYREAVPVLETVAGYRWSRYAVVAHIYLASSHLATNELDKAVNEAQRALAGTRPNGFYRQIALITLATAEEQKQDCKTAAQHYAEAQKISGALQGRAMLGKARCAEALGDTATAIAAYKEYLKDNPGSPLALKLAELETNSAPTSPSAK
jgi:predicted negative regulator of RcsB-dependent stress response